MAQANMIVWGDVHAHSGLSDDATGSALELFRQARDITRLDFIVLSDHDIYLTDVELATMHALAAAFDEPGRFVAFSGVEWSRAYHLNAYFLHDDVPICGGGGGPPCDAQPDFDRFYGPYIRTGEAAAHVNHPSWGVPWHDIDDTLLNNVEVWNTLWDRIYGRGPVHRDDPGLGGVLWALRSGLRLGFVGASDDHRSFLGGGDLLGTGLTACRVDALTRADVLGALRDRRCYATNGERIFVDFDVDGRPMGSELAVQLHSMVTANISVFATATPVAVELVRNGDVVARVECVDPRCALSTPVMVDDEYTFLYARVHRPGDRHAWASPVWVRGLCIRPSDCPEMRVLPARSNTPTSCLVRWRAIPHADRGANGRRRRRVSCVDGDPRCDFDADAGVCTFRVSVCRGETRSGPVACQTWPLDGYEVLIPSAKAEAVSQIELWNRRTLRTALAGLQGRDPGECSPYVEIRVPLRSRGETYSRSPYPIVIRAADAAPYDDERLKLVCYPHSSGARAEVAQ